MGRSELLGLRKVRKRLPTQTLPRKDFGFENPETPRPFAGHIVKPAGTSIGPVQRFAEFAPVQIQPCSLIELSCVRV